MEQYALFKALEILIKQQSWFNNQPFTFGFNYYGKYSPFDCGIYIRGDAPQSDRYRQGLTRDLQGNYYNRNARVQFLAEGDSTAKGNLNTSAFIGGIRNLLPVTIHQSIIIPDEIGYDGNNTLVFDPDGTLTKAEVFIVNSSLINDVIPLGKDDQSLMQYSLNTLIKYQVKEATTDELSNP